MKKVRLLTLVLLSFVVLSACSKGDVQSQPQNAATPSTEPAAAPAQNEMVGKDERKPMEVQLTKEQVKGIFGDTYTEVIDDVTGEWKVWRYDIMPKSGYKFETTTTRVDVQGIKNQDVQGQVFVMWDYNGSLISIVSYGLKDGSVKAYYFNGFTEEHVGE